VSGGRQRAALGQNLFRSGAPARTLVQGAGVQPGDLVYDLGAGTGRVTAALLAAGARVVAVELDPNLARKLAGRFPPTNVCVVEADLRQVAFRPPYRVVANPPFNQTAAIMRRLLFEQPSPDSAALVLQREAARKYAGAPRTTAISLAAQPWFALRVAETLDRRDLVPTPRVDVAVLRIERRAIPHLQIREREAWGAFVRWAFSRPSGEAARLFRPVLSRLQWRRLACDLAIDVAGGREELTLDQWLGLYRFVRDHVPVSKRRKALTPAR